MMYATNLDIAKATAEIAMLRDMTADALVQLVYVHHAKAAHCGNAYFEKRIERFFIGGLQISTQRNETFL